MKTRFCQTVNQLIRNATEPKVSYSKWLFQTSFSKKNDYVKRDLSNTVY